MLDVKFIRSLFSAQDYARGRDYYLRDRVEKLERTVSDGIVIYTCAVRGTEMYRVSFGLTEKDGQTRAAMYCTCPRFADRGECKHVAAAMLKAAEDSSEGDAEPPKAVLPDPEKPKRGTNALRGSGGTSAGVDRPAGRLTEQYLSLSSRADMTGEARLSPLLSLSRDNGEYPGLYLSVGVTRLYAVKDIFVFLENVAQRRTVAYGKNLTLFHGIENFDAPSRALIELLMDESRDFRLVRAPRRGYYDQPYGAARGMKGSCVRLEGSSFDRLFDILRTFPPERGLERLRDGDPAVTLSLSENRRAVKLSVEAPEELRFFGSRTRLYADTGDELLRCSDGFRDWVYPLLAERPRVMSLSKDDMSVFCGCALPRLRELVTVEDPEGIGEKYLPDKCVPRFYFDLDGDGSAMTLEVRFLYGDTEVMHDGSGGGQKTLRRDTPAETGALQFARRFFPERDASGVFRLSGDDAIYDLLDTGMDAFFERGEVFISDRLRGKRLRPAPAGVGISVSDGTLLLDIDTGEFPASELEELYQSLLEKRRYYRLRDGRYLTLDGSGYETLAEMAHMLRLSPGELESGHAKLPAYRGLYIDSVLSEREDMRVDRDAKFRAMIRDFKSLPEGGYEPPEEMDKILRPYQRVGFRWLKTLESCGFGGILADEMGLGKTVQMIAFLLTVRREVTGLPNLVVCPASLILNWMDETGRFAPGLSAAAVMGTAAERRRILENAGGADVIVTSYELLRQDIALYAEREFYCCVLDEGQHIKNSSTLGSKAVKRLRCRQRFIMTGTPMENRLSELWNLYDFLMPGYLYSHNAFVEKLEKPAVKSGDAEALEKLRRLVLPFMLRRVKKDVLRELPPVIEHVRRVALTEEERRVYLATAARIRSSLDGGGKLQILAALTRLRQICCDPALCYENYAGKASKLEACLELCAGMTENGHQILLFSQFTSMLDVLRPRLDELGITSFTLQGSTPKEKRAELVKRFNDGEAQVFLISLKAGGTGLNLTAADVVIHYDPWWNAAVRDQATGRAHRIGQRSCVQVYKLIAQDTVEEKIMALQDKKAELMSAISSGAEGDILNMSRDDLLAILT